MARLNERHNNVSMDINSNVKRLIKEFVSYIKQNYGEVITEEYADIKTDYDYITACIQLASQAVIEKNLGSIDLYITDFDIKIRNRSLELPIVIIVQNGDNNTISGGFSTDENENDPEIVIYINANNVSITDIKQGRNVVMNLIKTFSHEIAHCYQYISKQNYVKGEASSSNVPQGISYVVYYLKQNEIEAVCSSAFSVYKSRKQKMSYLNALCRTIDFALSETDNRISDNDLTPTYLQKKYQKHSENANLFMLNYFLKEGIKNTRYYKLVANEEDYKNAVSSLKDIDYDELKSVIDDIFNELVRHSEDEDYDTASAYWLVSSKKSTEKLYTSLEYALGVLDQIKWDDPDDPFIGDAPDEEEDCIVHGREDTWKD